MPKRTPFYEQHIALGGRMVDFAGWEMPLHYGSQLAEHRQVREDAGMFDVSHMTIVDLKGDGAQAYLRHLLANDVARLDDGRALYSCMLNEAGGIIDDLIVYAGKDGEYRVVVNAATHDKDLAWMARQAEGFSVTLTERDELAMIAVQGPNARDRVHGVLSAAESAAAVELKTFSGVAVGEAFIARTGYTGEDGYELMLPADRAVALWRSLNECGVAPIGLGARDTLRLEAGMALYGTDMDETISPIESGLAWTVAWEPEDRDFIGKGPLLEQRGRAGGRRMVGLLMEGRGVLRHEQEVCRADGSVIGTITSGAFSPVLGRAIAMARIEGDVGGDCAVRIRDQLQPVRIVKPPFVRFGKPCYKEA